MPLCYPLREWSQRTLPSGYDGPAYVSDIDKTYLATRFSSFKGLAKIPIEFAVDKASIAGMPEVLRGVRRGPGPGFASAPLYFVSSSPPQLRPVLERKMLLDGVQPDGLTFKDWAATVRQLRPGRLKDHLGFKLAALLHGRRQRLLSTEYLFGDDVERDAQSYSLYARALGDELTDAAFDRALEEGGVAADDRRCIVSLRAALPEPRGKVGGIFIMMVRSDAPEPIERHGRGVRAVRGAYQLALALRERGLVDRGCVDAARAALRAEGGLDDAALRSREEDALARGLASAESLGSR